MACFALPIAFSAPGCASKNEGESEKNERESARERHIDQRAAAPSGLVHLFTATVQVKPTPEKDAIVPPDGHEGAYLGDGDGAVNGERLRGTVRASYYSGNCLYPSIRDEQPVPGDLHLCTVNPGGVIETEDGARIRFDGRGYGLRSAAKYQVSMTMVFSTEAPRYAWLNRALGVMDTLFDEKTGRSTWHVFVPTESIEAR